MLPFIIPSKFKILNFFGISPLFSWANTFKIQEFRPKIKYFHQHAKFCTSFILIKFNKYFHSSYHENLRSRIFFWISPLFSWANTLKTQEFRPKIKHFHQHPKFCTSFILKKFNKCFPSSYHENLRSNFFFWISPQ